jgi:hypothetical protein
VEGPTTLAAIGAPYSIYTSGFASGSAVVGGNLQNSYLIIQGLDFYLPSGTSGNQFVNAAYINPSEIFFINNQTQPNSSSCQWRGWLPMSFGNYIRVNYSYPSTTVGVLAWGYYVPMPPPTTIT